MENTKKKKEGNGCTIAIIIAILLCLWGIGGITDGHSFIDGIFRNIKALVIFAVIALVVFGISDISK